MAVWWCAIAKNEENATYDELKARNVIAQGWPDLGILSDLVGKPDKVLQRELTNRGAEVRIFTNLLSRMRAGDLVVGIEGTEVRGICEVLPQSAYLNDASNNIEAVQHPHLAPNSRKFSKFNYAHCLYPVYWVDRNIVSPAWAPTAPAQSVQGIAGVVKDTDAVTTRWRQYVEGLGAKLPWTGAWLAERLRRRAKLERSLVMTEIDDIFSTLRQVILYGPPGTEKTHQAKQIAAHLIGSEEAHLNTQFSNPDAAGATGRWDIVQFPSIVQL